MYPDVHYRIHKCPPPLRIKVSVQVRGCHYRLFHNVCVCCSNTPNWVTIFNCTSTAVSHWKIISEQITAFPYNFQCISISKQAISVCQLPASHRACPDLISHSVTQNLCQKKWQLGWFGWEHLGYVIAADGHCASAVDATTCQWLV
jgi:hypothetical protein